MARMSNVGGGAASAWALVIFGFGFGICLLLAIILYTQLGGAQQREAEAQAQLAEYVNDDLANSPAVIPLRENSEPVVAQLLDRNRSLRNIVSSDEGATVDSIQQTINERGIERSLLRELNARQQEMDHRQERITQLQRELESERESAEALAEEKEQLRRSFDQTEQQLRDRLAELRSQFEQHQQAFNQTEQDMTSRVQQVRDHRETELRDLQRENEQLQQELQEVQRQLAEAEKQNQGVGPPNVVRSDGNIASVLQDEDKVYIDLGREDQMVLGMTFEVFDPDVMVKPDDYDQIRGKATIEVTEVNAESSLARVVRRERAPRGSGTVVSEGDQIVNVAYQPDARYMFHVYGKFDLDGTGNPTVADRQRIESMIKRWGGTITDELDYEVDYLVLGKEPELPEALPEGTIDPAKIIAQAAAKREYEKDQELVGQARTLDIPVLNQNRFLALVGHYQR